MFIEQKHSFSIYYTFGSDKLCLSQKNYVFQSKNGVYGSINSVYQIEKHSFFDKLCLSIEKHTLLVDKQCLSNPKAEFFLIFFDRKT